METKLSGLKASSRILSAVLLKNSLKNEESEPAWAEPLIGFSSGHDSLYGRLKDDIGEFYWCPRRYSKWHFMLNLRV